MFIRDKAALLRANRFVCLLVVFAFSIGAVVFRTVVENEMAVWGHIDNLLAKFRLVSAPEYIFVRNPTPEANMSTPRIDFLEHIVSNTQPCHVQCCVRAHNSWAALDIAIRKCSNCGWPIRVAKIARYRLIIGSILTDIVVNIQSRRITAILHPRSEQPSLLASFCVLPGINIGLGDKYESTLPSDDSRLIDLVGLNHLAELAGIDTRNSDCDGENKYLSNKSPTIESPPPLRRHIGVLIGTAAFGGGGGLLGILEARLVDTLRSWALLP